MEPAHNNYPLFESNQVLTSRHLNDLFSSLDEQDRLTRANLIGIGIVCGLKMRFDQATSTIHVSKGCGITSQGYLIDVPEEGMSLCSYREGYQVPDAESYHEFISQGNTQYPLWELCPVGEQNTFPLSQLDLGDKAVLLCLELKKQSLRNCSPSNCDNKGAEMIVTVKPLLIEQGNLDKIIECAKGLWSDPPGDPETILLKRLGVPDITLPRLDFPQEKMVRAKDIFMAFARLFKTASLASSTADALSKAYNVFKPILQERYPSDPFEAFTDAFGFLDEGPTTANQVIFLQYYYDLFDDLLKAYNEFRWKGAELFCNCCPPEGLFPHHLMLGSLISGNQPGKYRQHFMASPALNACTERTREVIQLFSRLVEMTHCFNIPYESEIRLTPSSLGEGLLSRKAIPWYYQQNGTPPLYQLWSYEKTMRGRSEQNLSYSMSAYNPDAPDPLDCDMEQYNFLRIEGHLGQNYQSVLERLLQEISKHNLPIDVVALHTGTSAMFSPKKSGQYSLHNFLKNHSGIQHKAGVPTGGTFILVYLDEPAISDTTDPFAEALNQIPAHRVIADFYLPYRIGAPDSFDYLDEQERLTRANLLGIGIVCGLKTRFDNATSSLHISKGSGITSQGYLIELPDMHLGRYREYRIPDLSGYPKFRYINEDNEEIQYPLWELFPADNEKIDSLQQLDLSDKAVLLFLELKKQSLRNCTQNYCDSRGTEVAVSVKPLLIEKANLDKIIAATQNLWGTPLSDPQRALLERLGLPDIRLPRFDVQNTNPVTSNDVFNAFFDVFNNSLSASITEALREAYKAFRPLLQDIYQDDPFQRFQERFGFLDQNPATASQVYYLQYYYDFFDDLIQAYNELRRKGAELLSACCPPEGLFPHHLMLGMLMADNHDGIYRHNFLPSPALGTCSGRTREVIQLFRRLVEMLDSFNLPELPEKSEIRITPSTLGNEALSQKAIPFYYQHNGTPPLFQLWSYEKTTQNRANQNLSYRFEEYSPVPDFVSNPLCYDLEPHNFLRIEGHLRKNYRSVMKRLLLSKTQYRLPIDIIALRSGEYDDKEQLEDAMDHVRIRDLQALYDVLREEVLTTLTEEIRFLYDIAITPDEQLPSGTPQHPLLITHASDYTFKENTLGAWCEMNWQYVQTQMSELWQIQNDNQRGVSNSNFLNFTGNIFSTGIGINSGNNRLQFMEYNKPYIVLIAACTKYFEILQPNLDELTFTDFEKISTLLLNLVHVLRDSFTQREGVQQDDFVDHLDEMLFSSRFDSIKKVYADYLRRIRLLKERKFLNSFLQKHPGIEHKAGVPPGGTFIIVYHQSSPTVGVKELAVSSPDSAYSETASSASAQILADSCKRIASDMTLASQPDIKILLDSLTKTGNFQPHSRKKESIRKIIADAVGELEDGTVIADFYLPYQIAADGEDVQFVLPESLPVKECEYRWIDSLKHLNSISLRDYRPVGTKKAPAAAEKERDHLKESYIIRIYNYEIQGQSLLKDNRPVDILVPIRGKISIKSHKLAAVARALNEMFPLGLVFDNVRGSDKLLIRFIDGQKFRIEWGGIQGNQIRYAYENDGIYRWQHNRWEEIDRHSAKAVGSHIAGRNYKEQEYRWMHQHFAPVNVVPVSGPTAKELIKWEKQTLIRARNYPKAENLPIYTLLGETVKAIHSIDPEAIVLLIGGWANGSWVSRNRSENIKSFGDEIALKKFLELRRKVTGKTGYSDIHLLVESEEPITSEMIKVTTGYSITIIRGKKDAQKGMLLEEPKG